jgi:uncharacterized membrane protein YdjX (TVP38/TMEM64 family)
MAGHSHRAHHRSSRRNESAHHALLFGITKNRRALWTVATVTVVVIAAVALILLYTDLSWANVTDWIHRVDPVVALPLMAVLPIFGFPIAIVYLFAGARFGPIGGGLVVAVITAIHLAGTHLIANSFLRNPLRRWIERKHQHLPEIPEDEHAPVCLIASLVPGLPYFVRNYLLALGGVKLRYLFMVCLPIYIARSYVTILLGNMGSEPTTQKLLILLGVDGLKVAICAYVIWRLRTHHRKFHGPEHDHRDHEHDVLPRPNAAAK